MGRLLCYKVLKRRIFMYHIVKVFLCVIEETFCTIIYNLINSQEFRLMLRYGKI